MNALLTFFIILYAIVCVLLILLVIVQGGRAEGLFASAQANVLGSRGADVLTKITRGLSAIFIVGALLISMFISSQRSVLGVGDTSAPAGALSAQEAEALELQKAAAAEAERQEAEKAAAAEAEKQAAEKAAAEKAAEAERQSSSSSSSSTATNKRSSSFDDEAWRLSQTTAGGN